MAANRAPCAPGGGLVLLTNMQWFYGPTWGRTLNLCASGGGAARGSATARFTRNAAGNAAGCARWPEILDRQLELLEVLRRNLEHSSVGEVHVLVGEAEPVHALLERTAWYARRHRCKLTLVPTRVRPTFRDYLLHAGRALPGRTVVLANQDIFLGDGWEAMPRTLPPRTAFFLSRSVGGHCPWALGEVDLVAR